jgi:hypothetical protein
VIRVNTLAFWNALITALCAAIIIGFSCALIFYTKIFEKWDRTKVIDLEDYNGYNAIATYIVNGKEYKRQIGHDEESYEEWLYKAWGGELELYVDYLVSDPNYILPHNTRRDAIIELSILWVASVGISVVVLIRIYKKDTKNKKISDIKRFRAIEKSHSSVERAVITNIIVSYQSYLSGAGFKAITLDIECDIDGKMSRGWYKFGKEELKDIEADRILDGGSTGGDTYNGYYRYEVRQESLDRKFQVGDKIIIKYALDNPKYCIILGKLRN